MDAPDPVACTLTPKRAHDQLLEWVDLQHVAIATHAIPNGARVHLPLALRDRIADLAARERACCSFLTISIDVELEHLVLSITSTHPDAQPFIAALTGAA